MPEFRYRALTATGKLVSGSISAMSASEVSRRIDYLGLVLVDELVEQSSHRRRAWTLGLSRTIRPEDVTTFTLDLALLLKAGARLDEALELLATDLDLGGLRPTVAGVRASILSGDSLADALQNHPSVFPPMYIALVRVGEASGSLDSMLSVLARERSRSEEVRRKLADALRYPTFVLFAAILVLIFFLMFVLPQFSAVLRDFGVALDPFAAAFMSVSEFLTAHQQAAALTALLVLVGLLISFKHPQVRSLIVSRLASLPGVQTITSYHRAGLLCRNLHVLLTAAVPLPATLKILADMMGRLGDKAKWSAMVEHVRHGGKLADALSDVGRLPSMSVRMLRLGEETAQLPAVAGRVAEFYELKLQRALDRVVAIVGPLAIITISAIVGGLIVSVMTSLLSVSQLVG